MNSLVEYLERFRNFVFESITKFEDSPFYEQMFSKWESLDPSQQKTITVASRVLGIGLVLYLFLSPLLTLWESKNLLSEQRTLLAEMKVLNNALATRPRPAQAPRDWQNLPASNTDEAHQSLRSFMASIGLPEGTYQTLPSTGGQLQIDIPETNLRQVHALLYQIDGWYPDITNEVVTVKTHSEDPQKLTFTLTLNHSSGEAFSANPTATTPRNTGSGSSGSSSSGSNSSGTSSGSSGSSGGDSFDGDSEFNSDEFGGSDSYSDFEGSDAASNLDSLPPPPPFEDEEF